MYSIFIRYYTVVRKSGSKHFAIRMFDMYSSLLINVRVLVGQWTDVVVMPKLDTQCKDSSFSSMWLCRG